ncbi:MAG: hypothetical protein R3A48_10450 [Polyangiales bacterium]
MAHRPPTTFDLRVFGVGLLVLAAWLGHRSAWHPAAIVATVFGAGAAAAAALSPRALSPVYRGWMRVVTPIGRVVSTLALALVYFGVLVPYSRFVRRQTRETMPLDRDPSLPTYWSPRERARGGAERHFRQF